MLYLLNYWLIKELWNRFDGCLTIRNIACLYDAELIATKDSYFLVLCRSEIFFLSNIKSVRHCLKFEEFHIVDFYFHKKSNWISCVDINAMNVYLLCCFNFSNNTLICLACHKYTQNQQNKTQSKVINFIWSYKKSNNLEFLIWNCRHCQIIELTL